MRWAHLRAILWMRWRVLMNRISRRGKTAHALVILLVVLASLLAISSFLGTLGLGVAVLSENSQDQKLPVYLMFAWSGITLMLLFGWMVGVMMELQRSESMSFQSLLHLPASLLGVHLYNYVGSFVSLSLFFVLPVMLGLAAASLAVFGAGMLLLLPLVVGFVCLLTALTYQLRGWLGTMMQDKRKRKNVITLITICFVLLVQIPNFINLMSRDADDLELVEIETPGEPAPGLEALQAAPDPASPLAASAGRNPAEEEAFASLSLEQRQAETDRIVAEAQASTERKIAENQAAADASVKERLAQLRERERLKNEKQLALAQLITTRVCLFFPLGWLPLGAHQVYAGNYGLALLCILGLFSLTALSLRRSYRTTLSFVTGVGSAGERAPGKLPKAKAPQQDRVQSGPLFVGRSLPWIAEPVACVGLAGMRNLWKAPEFKLVFLMPLILLILALVMLITREAPEVHRLLRPAVGLGGLMLGVVSMQQILQNQFGMDRDGFRALVLSPIPRHQILLGKNLSAAPFALGIGFFFVLASQFSVPMGILALLGTLMLGLAGFLLLSLGANAASILSPMRFKEGALQAANAKFKVILMQFVSFFASMFMMLPLLLPLGFAALADWLGFGSPSSIYIVTSGLLLLISVLLYRFVIPKQGAMLVKHEQRILDVLTRAVD